MDGLQIEIEIRIRVGLEEGREGEGGRGEHLSFHGWGANGDIICAQRTQWRNNLDGSRI